MSKVNFYKWGVIISTRVNRSNVLFSDFFCLHKNGHSTFCACRLQNANSYVILRHTVWTRCIARKPIAARLSMHSWEIILSLSFTCNVCFPTASGTYLHENVPSLLSFNAGSTLLPFESKICRHNTILLIKFRLICPERITSVTNR